MASQVIFSEMVAALVKNGQDILKELTPEQADLLHMGVGVSGESGELLDAIKKHAIYGKPLDRENIIEELGDLEFFMERIRQIIGVSREETIAANMAKLGKRYSKGTYSNEQAQARADKGGSMIFALCGSHRTGKTTLAQEFARVSGAKFIPMSITRLQKEIGFNSANQRALLQIEI